MTGVDFAALLSTQKWPDVRARKPASRGHHATSTDEVHLSDWFTMMNHKCLRSKSRSPGLAA